MLPHEERALEVLAEGLPYDRERTIENIKAGFRQGLLALYEVGRNLIILQQNEGELFYQIIEEHFPGLHIRTAYRYMLFARKAAKLPNFKAFCEARGGWSKGLTLLCEAQEGELEELEETGSFRGYSLDDIDRMSVRQLKRALRRAREEKQQAINKTAERVAIENSELRRRIEVLEASLNPEVEEVVKVVGAINDRLLEIVRLLKRIPRETLLKDRTLRQTVFGVTGFTQRLIESLEHEATEAEIEAQAREEEEWQTVGRGGGHGLP